MKTKLFLILAGAIALASCTAIPPAQPDPDQRPITRERAVAKPAISPATPVPLTLEDSPVKEAQPSEQHTTTERTQQSQPNQQTEQTRQPQSNQQSQPTRQPQPDQQAGRIQQPEANQQAKPPAQGVQTQQPKENRQPQGAGSGPAAPGAPPTEAVAACQERSEQATCEFTWQKGAETGICETVQGQLTCSPQHGPAPAAATGEGGARPAPAQGSAPAGGKPAPNQGAGQAGAKPAPAPGAGPAGGQALPANQQGGAPAYNLEQAISDRAQGTTIAFDALAFLTGDLGSDSFFPPGKVADFWGFQYLRDNDTSEMGHAGDFLTSAAMNVLKTLTAEQRGQLIALAKSQVASINEYGYKRFVLMDAFRRLLEGDLPAGATGLSEEAVKAYSAKLYELDGEISFARAQLMGMLITALDATQRAHLDSMVGKGMREWPDVTEPDDVQKLDRDVKVAVMTYAADLFSWYAGSIDADVYFCPERHGTYFGSFYLKDRKAMDDPTYAIPTELTGDMGDRMLSTLTADQAKTITGLVEIQRPSLEGIVDVRKQVSEELRKFKSGGTADSATVTGLMEKYGELDGAIAYRLATNFAEVGKTLTDDQKTKLTALRQEMLGELMHPSGAYLYSQAIPMPEIRDTDFLFK